MSDPVTRSEMRDEVHAAEGRSEALIETVVGHFDQRLKDSERVLTWRMVATVGVGSVLSGLMTKLAGGDEVARSAVAAVSRLFS